MRLWPRKQVYLDDLPKTHDLRFSVLFVGLFVLVIAAVYGVGYFVAGDRLAPGTTIGDVDVGGMRSDEARTELQQELAPRLAQPIAVTFAGRTFEVDPQEAGLTFDLEASVQAGLGSSAWDPRHMLEVVTGGDPLPIAVDFDQAEFDATIAPIAAEVATPARNATVVFDDGAARVVGGSDGQQVDAVRLRALFTDALLDGDRQVALPVRAVRPAVTPTDASDFVRDVAEPAMRSDVRIRVADRAVVVPPRVFAPALRARTEGDALRLVADPVVLAERSRALLADVRTPPVDARIVFRARAPVVVPGRPGRTVSDEAWATAVTQAALGQGNSRRAAAAIEQQPPGLTTAEVRQLGVEQSIAAAELRVPGRVDVASVQAVAARLDGLLMRPQQQASALARLGGDAPTEASVVASAWYDAAFRAGLGLPQRQAPRVRNPASPDGLDAWVAPGSDLGIVNTSPYGVYVRAGVVTGDAGRQVVRVALWSTPYFEVDVSSSGRYNVDPPTTRRQVGPDCRDQAPQTGFTVDVARAFVEDGEEVKRETAHSVYPRIDEVVCRR